MAFKHKTAAPPIRRTVGTSSKVATPPEKKFVEDLVIRGDAAKSVDGKLPAGATHEIVSAPSQGQPIVVRRRFSLT